MAATEKKGREHPTSYDAMFKAFTKMGVKHPRVEAVKHRSTGILSLDLLFHGGLPVSRMVLHFGSEGSGKTTMWSIIARNFIDKGDPVFWLDAERALDKRYLELLGMNVDHAEENRLLDVVKTQTAQQAMDALIMALELRYHKLIVVDTLAKLVPDAEAAASVSKDQMALQARLYARATRVWAEALDESDATLVVLNQERLDLGAYGTPSTNPGGKAITKHEPSLIIFSQRNSNKYANGLPTDLIFNYTLKKWKTFEAAPIASVKDYHQLHIKAGRDAYEIDYAYELYDAAVKLGVLQDKDGGLWKTNVAFFKGEKLGNGAIQVEAFFNDKTPLRDQVEALIVSRLQEGNYGTQGAAEPVYDDAPGDPEQPGEADAPEPD